MSAPPFGSIRCLACMGRGTRRGQPCQSCDGEGWTTPARSEPQAVMAPEPYQDPDGYPPSAWDTSSDYGPREAVLGVPMLARDAMGTSINAAASLDPVRLTDDARKYLEWAGGGGTTDDAAEAVLGLHPSATRARRASLIKAGYIVETTERRPTRTGRMATVWEVTAAGMAAISAWSGKAESA